MSPMKLLLSLALVLFAMSSIAGCGQKEESTEPAATEAEPAAAEAETVVAEAEEVAAEAMSPQDERHELMDGTVKDGAKVIAPMLQGKADYDAAAAMAALESWQEVSQVFGDLFPEGSEGGEAAPAIWEDREGFDAALVKWQDATGAAIAASPQTLDDARAAIGPVFDTCKNCHDTYRIEEEEEE